MSFALVALLLAAAPAQFQPPNTIVVVGEHISDAREGLRTCLSRRCPPNEDIDATLRLAETQLLAGKYRDARKTLLESLGRNKDHARAYPIPVSDLYRANGKVAAHLGFDKDYYNSTWGIYRTLKFGLPSADQRRLTAMMEVAEMMFRTRGHTRARIYYDRVAKEARKVGRPDVAAIAELRSAVRHLPPNSSIQLQEIRRIAGMDGKSMRAPVIEAKMALARLAYQKGDEAEAARQQRELANLNIRRPMLIYSPSYSMVQQEVDSGSEFGFPFAPPPGVGGDSSAGGGGPTAGPASPGGGDPGGIQSSNRVSMTSILALSQWSTLKRIAGNFEDMWIDVGFRITEEGRVADPQILRSKGDLFWAAPLMASIRGRRYTAGKLNASSYRRERYTYTSGYEGQTGTRVSQRSPKARVEYVDLSDISAPD